MSKYGKKMEAVVTILVDSYNADFLKSLTHSALFAADMSLALSPQKCWRRPSLTVTLHYGLSS